jgi:hypothetical protein
MIWLLPLVLLGAGGGVAQVVGVSAAFLTVCWMTTWVYPVHYYDLLDGRFAGPDLLLARKLLLLLPEKNRT